VFKEGDRGAIVDGTAPAPARAAKRAAPAGSNQGDLF
jgi:hypothetical protein